MGKKTSQCISCYKDKYFLSCVASVVTYTYAVCLVVYWAVVASVILDSHSELLWRIVWHHRALLTYGLRYLGIPWDGSGGRFCQLLRWLIGVHDAVNVWQSLGRFGASRPEFPSRMTTLQPCTVRQFFSLSKHLYPHLCLCPPPVVISRIWVKDI